MMTIDHLIMPASRSDNAPHQAVDPTSYRAAMRSHAGAVTIFSTGISGDRTGLTATSVCSLSDDPPRVIACVNRSASAHSLVRKTGVFGLNMLRADQVELANLFAGRRGIDRENRFHDADGWISVATGAPILRNALASFDCQLVDEHSHDTHSIFVGEVKAVHVHDEYSPLVYFAGKFRSLSDLCT